MDLINNADHRIVAAVFLALLIGVGEISFREGRRRTVPSEDIARGQIGTIQGALLALMGLLLAFTFGMAGQRYDFRRIKNVEEVNAIGTAYLRTDFLPDPAAGETRRILRDYVGLRIDYYQAEDEDRLPALLQKAEALQAELWSRGVESARQDPRSVPIGLFVQSLNDVIDLHATVTAAQSHVPTRILTLLMIVAATGIATVGYAFGLARRRQVFGTVTLAILVSAIVLVSLDLDQPRSGRIRISARAMSHLREVMSQPGR